MCWTFKAPASSPPKSVLFDWADSPWWRSVELALPISYQGEAEFRRESHTAPELPLESFALSARIEGDPSPGRKLEEPVVKRRRLMKRPAESSAEAIALDQLHRKGIDIESRGAEAELTRPNFAPAAPLSLERSEYTEGSLYDQLERAEVPDRSLIFRELRSYR